jgi:hypothetical protein
MGLENGLHFNMMTLAYDRYDFKRKIPYPNGWGTELYDYADTIDEMEYFNIVRSKFDLASSHSELRGNVIDRNNGKYVILKDMDFKNYDGEVLFYPIEIFGSHNYFTEEAFIKKNDVIQQSIKFAKVVSNEAIELAKLNKLKFIFNISHEPFSDKNFIFKFSEEIKKLNLKESDFIFFGGSSNLFDLYPEIKSKDFIFYFEDDLLISSCKKINDLKNEPNYKLGYKSEWFNLNDVLNKRSKHFVCPNRNSNKSHRFTLGCFFEIKNLWDKVYCSFLQKTQSTPIINNLSIDFKNKILENVDSFIKKLPIEMDTENLNETEKESFESLRAFKKEIYLDSYIHIITETNFEKDIFPTEKLINPIIVLQPFILFGAPGYLKYIKELGFKTFNGFINESYDNEYDSGKRFEMLCNEIDRLSKLSLEEMHNWYISIIPILEYNRNFAMEFANKTMFIENLKKHI